MSSALWWVTNGRAVAPPGMGCSSGVSTSVKRRSISSLRSACITALRTAKTRREGSLTMRST